MALTPRGRKFAMTVHVTASVGWLGSVVAYLALAVVGFTSHDAQVSRASYLSMEVVATFVVVPFSIATLLSGIAEAVTTRWGLFRHWWVLAKFALTTVAALILWQHMPAVARMATLAGESALSIGDLRAQRLQLVLHALGGLLVLLTATVLSVYKPWGLTPFARRMESQSSAGGPIDLPASPGTAAADAAVSARAPRWVNVVWIHALALGLLFLAIHLAGGGLRAH